MKSLLFALGLALCCVVQAELEEVTTCSEEDMGRWVSFAVACNSSDHLEQLKHMPAFVAYLSKPKEGLLRISVHILMPDGCKKLTYEFRKGEDGKYYNLSDDTKVTVESVKALGKFAISTINISNTFRTTILHGRTATEDPEITQKFKEECMKIGYKEHEIVVLNPTVRCE